MEVAPGETATVSIVVEDVTDLFCFELKVDFDPAKIEVVDANPDAPGVQIADGDFLSTDWKLQNEVDNEGGSVAYALCQLNPSEPQSGGGVLATITWRAGEPGTSPVNLYDVILAAPMGAEIPAEVEDGEIIVASAEPAPGETPQRTPTAAPSPTSSPSPATPTVAPPTSTPLPTATATASGNGGRTQTPTPDGVSGEPTATVEGGVTATSAQDGPSTTSTPTERATPTSEQAPTRTSTSLQTVESGEQTTATATEAPSEGADQGETSRSGLFGLSSTVLLLVALGCLIVGVGALIFASVLWKRKER